MLVSFPYAEQPRNKLQTPGAHAQWSSQSRPKNWEVMALQLIITYINAQRYNLKHNLLYLDIDDTTRKWFIEWKPINKNKGHLIINLGNGRLACETALSIINYQCN